ncbi:hypothetical protein BKA80DRAFT_277323 [Phyllosticta citrichinensis]
MLVIRAADLAPQADGWMIDIAQSATNWPATTLVWCLQQPLRPTDEMAETGRGEGLREWLELLLRIHVRWVVHMAAPCTCKQRKGSRAASPSRRRSAVHWFTLATQVVARHCHENRAVRQRQGSQAVVPVTSSVGVARTSPESSVWFIQPLFA